MWKRWLSEPIRSTAVMSILKRLAFLIPLMLFFLISSVAAGGNVRLLIMDGINLEHIVHGGYPSFAFLLKEGAIGLANAGTAGGRSRENTAITLNSGSRALGHGANEVYPVLMELESGSAGAVHARRTGVYPPAGALVMPEVAAIALANSELQHTVKIGLLGKKLAQAGVSAAALVSSGFGAGLAEGAAIIADSNGIVQGGRVFPFLPEATAPYGLAADLPSFLASIAEHSDVDVLVIDLGDTGLLADYMPLVVQARQEYFREQALERLDAVLAKLLSIHGEEDLLMVVGLRADKILATEEGKLLVPLIVYGPGFSGLLSSATTRRPGVVAATDITATVLNHFGLSSTDEGYGQPLFSRGEPNPIPYLLTREKRMAATYRLRPPLLKGLIIAIIALTGLILLAHYFRWRRLNLLKFGLLMILASPFVLLVLALAPASLWLVPAWAGLAALIAYFLSKVDPGKGLKIIGAATALLIIFDALVGAPLQKNSILGYDAIAGCRYYGIGNEYMGALLGSTLLALGRTLAERRLLAGFILAAVVLVLMLPGLGANFGGALAALSGFTFALFGLGIFREKKYRLRAAALIAGALALLVFSNLGREQSHVGRFFTAVFADPDTFFTVVARKLAMNWRLIRWSLWTKAFGALFVAAFGVIFSRRKPLARLLGKLWPQVRGALAAAFAALVFNDSGIVAAAMVLLYMTLPLLYYWLSSSSFAINSHSL